MIGASNAIIIALGNNGEHYTLSEDSRRCAEKASELFKRGRGLKVILSGGWSFKLHKRPKLTEAEGMEIVLLKNGVPKARILKEEKSLDTAGNALYCRPIVRAMHSVKKIILVTNRNHMPRAAYLFRKAFPEYAIEMAPFGLPSDRIAFSVKAERAKLAELKKEFEGIKTWEGFRNIILNMHPLYGSNPSTIPEYIWKGFEKQGFSKRYLISKYMKHNARNRATHKSHR
ncbi:MAG: YdcF family protein [Candidatus Micrarchaeia archaeon]